MKPQLAQKLNDTQMRENAQTRVRLVACICSMDLVGLKELLLDNHIYMGNKNKWQTLKWFDQQFQQMKNSCFQIEENQGTSLEHYPGAEAFEIIFTGMDWDLLDDPNYHTNGGLFKSGKTEQVVIRLVAIFAAGKVTDIRQVKQVVKPETAKRFAAAN